MAKPALLLIATVVALLPATGARAAARKIDFGKADLGTTPSAFTPALTGEGGAVAWMIAEDPTAPSPPRMLAQSSTEATENRFPLCIYDSVSAKDVVATVRFKVVSGKVARGAGVALRVRDAENYYVALANALGDGVSLEKVVAGKRTRIGKAKAGIGEDWHALALDARGRHLVVSVDGKRLIEADDAALAGAGKVALVTQADSVAFFDDLEIDARDRDAR